MRLNTSDYASLRKAVSAVYDENARNEINEQNNINDFMVIIETLVEGGYDFSEYTYDEIYESYVSEGWGQMAANLARNPNFWKAAAKIGILNWADEKFLKGGGKRFVGDVLKTNLQTVTGQGAKPEENKPKQSGSGDPLGLRQDFDPFDVIKGHLISEGYADTEEAAIAIMANMSEDWKKTILDLPGKIGKAAGQGIQRLGSEIGNVNANLSGMAKPQPKAKSEPNIGSAARKLAK